jgi:large subunit ribosomal protein L16
MTLLQPKKVKHRKIQKGKGQLKGLAHRGNRVSYGDFGLQVVEAGFLTARQLEAARRVITRHLKRDGQVWIRVFPDKPMTKKPIGVRQGGGKGSVEYWVAVVKPGHMVFEVAGVAIDIAKKAFKLASAKLPLRTIFVERTVI